jgi:hypothetical protein
MVYVTLRSASYIRPYVIDFLRIVAPTLTAPAIRDAMRASRRQAAERV